MSKQQKSFDHSSLTPGEGENRIDLLTEILLSESDLNARLQSARALVESGNKQAVHSLVKAMGDRDYIFRAKLVKIINRLPHPATTEAVIAAMDDDDPYVRKSAIEAAQNINSPESVKAIARCLSDEEINVRESAVIALERSREAALVVEVLSAVLTDSHWNVRRECVEVLGKTGLAEAIGPLKRMLRDEDSEVRRSALLALANVDRDGIVETALAGLNDRDQSVVLEALYLLGEFGGAQVIPVLDERGHSENCPAIVRSSISQVISRINNRDEQAC